MRIRANFFVSLDGFVAPPDRRPVQLLLEKFTGADSYGLPEFLAGNEAVVMGRTTFLPALEHPSWPWRNPVFVLTSSALPERTPDDVTAAASPGELVERMRAAGIDGDVHLVGGPSTMHAFRAAGALDELWVHVVPILLGEGVPLSPGGTDRVGLELTSTQTYPDGVVQLGYAVR